MWKNSETLPPLRGKKNKENVNVDQLENVVKGEESKTIYNFFKNLTNGKLISKENENIPF